MPPSFKYATLCLNWILALGLGYLWYAHQPIAAPATSSTPVQSSTIPVSSKTAPQQKTPPALAEALRARAEAYRKSAELSATSRNSSKEEGYARTNGMWLPALKDPVYHAKLNRSIKLDIASDKGRLFQILNLSQEKRETLIDLLANRAIEGVDAQELASGDAATQRQMSHRVLSDYQAKIVDLLDDKFWLYNQCVALTEFRRETLEPAGNLLEIYGTPLTRDQQADLVDWFFSDNKRQRAPYESLATWAESDRSKLTAQQKQTLGPVLQELSALNPPKTKKPERKAPAL